RAWMYRILRNSFLSSRTGMKTMVVFDEEDYETVPATESPSAESVLLAQANRQLVQEALEELPVHYREILLLCEVEEMSYQEISETLSIPIGTVMSRLSRARKMLGDRLRQELQKEQNHGLRVLEDTTRHIPRR